MIKILNIILDTNDFSVKLLRNKLSQIEKDLRLIDVFANAGLFDNKNKNEIDHVVNKMQIGMLIELNNELNNILQ